MIADRRSTSVFVLVVLALASCGGADDRPFAGTRRSPAPVIESTLPAVGGDDFVFRAEPDDVLVVYFGYTSCPDVCPTTMTDLTFARTELGDDAERVDVAMVTVDPQRDSEEILTDYVNSFVPGSTAVRTEDELELRAAADELGVFYEVEELSDGTVEVAHSGTHFALDDRGELTASWPFGTPAADLQNDLAILLSETQSDDAEATR